MGYTNVGIQVNATDHLRAKQRNRRPVHVDLSGRKGVHFPAAGVQLAVWVPWSSQHHQKEGTSPLGSSFPLAPMDVSTLGLLALNYNRQRHTDGLHHAEQLHHAETQLATDLHRMEMAADSKRLREALALDRQLQMEELEMERAFDYRDQTRDTLAFRSEIVQSLLLADTLMLGGAFSFVYGVALPASAPSWLLTLHLCALVSSSLALCLSTAVAFALQARIQYYDIHRPEKRYWCGHVHSGFKEYYDCRGATLEMTAQATMYAGSSFLLLAAGSFVTAQLVWRFPAIGVGGAAGFIAPCCLAVAWMVVGGWALPTATLLTSSQPVVVPEAALTGSFGSAAAGSAGTWRSVNHAPPTQQPATPAAPY